jgi:hypothetical protein
VAVEHEIVQRAAYVVGDRHLSAAKRGANLLL